MKVCPDKFSRAICEGTKLELDTSKWRNKLQTILDVTKPFGKSMMVQMRVEEIAKPPEENPFKGSYEGKDFVDDINGAPLNKNIAIEGRKAEMKYFKTMGVYSKIRIETLIENKFAENFSLNTVCMASQF